MLRILITGGNGNIANMIRRGLSHKYDIINVSRTEFDLLNYSQMKEYLDTHSFDIVVHTAILGGRRTKTENGEITHINLVMFENLLRFSDRFQMIINLDSGAIYNRSEDILNRKEIECVSVPTDYYGFSKYIIHQRSLAFSNIMNLRIFNIFHVKEEPDRFISVCFSAKKSGTDISIFEDKYFDFMSERDFIRVVDYYFSNNICVLPKTLNLCYSTKYKLSEIAELIVGQGSRGHIQIHDNRLLHNYCGDSAMIDSLQIGMDGLEKSLQIYENNLMV